MMAILGGKRLKEELDSGYGIRVTPELGPVSDRVGKGGLDVHLGMSFCVARRRALGTYDVLSPDLGDAIRDGAQLIHLGLGEKFFLHPGDLVLAGTLEYIALSHAFAASVIGRSSLGRLGLIVATATSINPGFKGIVTLELVNLGTAPIVIYPGIRVAQLVFETVESASGTGTHVPSKEEVPRDFPLGLADFWELNPGKYQFATTPEASRMDRDPGLALLRRSELHALVGVCGRQSSGKSTAYAELGELGWSAFSARKLLNECARQRGLPLLQRTLHRIGTELRLDWHDGIVAERLLEAVLASRATHAVIGSIRHVGELECLFRIPQFHLLVLTADEMERKARRQKELDRGNRDREPFDAGEWTSVESLEGGGDETDGAQNVQACIDEALAHTGSRVHVLKTDGWSASDLRKALRQEIHGKLFPESWIVPAG